MIVCPVCEERFLGNEISLLSSHLFSKALSSNPEHIMWLNRNISNKKITQDSLNKKLVSFYDFTDGGLTKWIREKFVNRFFSEDPNIFIKEMQVPSKYTIMGYVTEHYHFLKQWVKSCAYIIARTDYYDVQKYELQNISEEYFGVDGRPAHIELLLEMGESVGLAKEMVMNSKPLKKTENAIRYWEHVSSSEHWLDAMVSMHSLELIADKNVKKYGAKYSYFKPEILDGLVTKEAATFLRAGYEADQFHSEDALRLVEKYAKKLDMEREVQSYFLKSIDHFSKYLEARYERGKMYEAEL